MALVIAIDGPAGAGKSTTARRLAEKTGFNRLDTGLFYRSIAYGVHSERGEWPKNLDPGYVASWTADNRSRIQQVGGRLLLDQADITSLCRSAEASANASAVAGNTAVREVVDSLTAEAIETDPATFIFSDGRDETRAHYSAGRLALGIYLTATVELRAIRRHAEIMASVDRADEDPDLRAVLVAIAERDLQDMTRGTSPLLPTYELGFRFVRSSADFLPKDVVQVGVDSGQFQDDERAQDDMIIGGLELIAA
jgi:cytidylate kinase